MNGQMATIQIEQSLADLIGDEAQARGLSIETYLRSLVTNGDSRNYEDRISLAEIDRVLDELSEGTDDIIPLPANFSREDIYFDHD